MNSGFSYFWFLRFFKVTGFPLHCSMTGLFFSNDLLQTKHLKNKGSVFPLIYSPSIIHLSDLCAKTTGSGRFSLRCQQVHVIGQTSSLPYSYHAVIRLLIPETIMSIPIAPTKKPLIRKSSSMFLSKAVCTFFERIL